MIKNLPKANDYENVSIECLIQAYNNIVTIDSYLTNATPREHIWEYNQVVLRTCLVLVHQGIEGLLKAVICNVSPLLLLDKKRSEWKTLPESKDESFDDLYTIGGEDLLRTFFGCQNPKNISPKFLNLYEEVRTKRNKIVHGTAKQKLSPEEVLKFILNTFTFLLGRDTFWNSVCSKFYGHPGFEFGDENIEWEDEYFYNRMDHLDFFLGKKELKKHFSVDISARPYLCPICTEKAEKITSKGIERPESKWAFLNPNKPGSTDMSCIVCRTDFGVVRQNCGINDCKGDVQYLIEEEDLGDNDIYVCLTCWKSKDDL
ncbi:hypothetical protein [uncultured Mucilaginibacter sp.]|uniref:hypothetical protein n=1 Tax=uncultured Mucilaginibacter sp. TaxID=797541 RepID=UPI0025E559E1|nr:hypothetical protein [uncultured Mucilaginibacter sp.]